jgi:hypothetical protein
MYFFRLLLWALCLVCAWIGAGGLAARLLGLRERSWSLNGVLGISLFVLVGGFLNLAQQVRPWPLVSLVVFGDVLFIIFLVSARSSWKTIRSLFHGLQTWGKVFAAFCGAGLLTAAVHSLTFTRFNFSDDLPAYMTFPFKLIQLGSLGFDPFSERRVQSGLGASFFLQACMLVAGDVRSLWFPDAGAGLIFFAGCVYAAGRRLGNTPAFAIVLASLVVLVPSSHMNLGMSVLPAAFFIAFFLVETAVETTPLRRSIMLGLLGATVTMLKSTYLPPAILIIAILHIVRIRKQPWGQVLRDVLASGFAYLVPLLPWMIDMKRKEGTFLYPLLGKGYEISAYGVIPHMIKIGLYPWALGLVILICLVGAAVVHWMLTREREYADQVTAILLACGLCVLPLSVSVAGAAVLRYIGPFVLPCCLLFLGSLLPLARTGMPRPRLLPVGYVYVAGLLLILEAYGATHGHYELFLPDGVLENPMFRVDLPAEQLQASRIQAALPPGEPLYASLMVTFPMDFRRNQIYVADFPGMASLPPGMPTQGAPQALRSYLLTNHIRYVAYSAKFRNLLLTDSGDWILSPSKAWPRMQLMNSTDVDHELEALAPTSRTVFDDGDVKVLDLSH